MPSLAPFRFPPRLRRCMAALAPVVLTEEVEELGIVEEVLDEVELFLRTVPAPLRAGIMAGLWSFEQSARIAPSSLGRGFASLSLSKRQRHFERWWHTPGPGHQLARGLKMFLAFAYYEHPQVQARMGYDPDAWIAKVKAEREARFAKEHEALEAKNLMRDPLRGSGGRRLPQAAQQETP